MKATTTNLGFNGLGQDIEVTGYNTESVSIEIVAWENREGDEFEAIELKPAQEAALRALLNARAVASPAAPAVQTGEAACGCGHILAQHDVGYSTPYQCRAGAVCLCGRFKAAVEPTAGTP